MAIPKFLENLEIISKLGDYPGSDNNLSASQLKAKFDEGVLKLQNYINNTLVPALDQIVDVEALLNSVIDKTLTQPDKTAEAKATGDALNKKLDKTGGTMTGDLHVKEPTESTHAASMGYVDGKKEAVSVTLLRRCSTLPLRRPASLLAASAF